MRIGILTLRLGANYGGLLQAYALQTILERMGHEVTVLDKKFKCSSLPVWKMPLIYPIRFMNKVLKRKKNNIVFLERYVAKVKPIVEQNADKFIAKYIHRTLVDDYSKFEAAKELDAIVVGSDQVWRPKYFGVNIENAFLNFAKNAKIKRVAYAPSFGVDTWEYNSQQTGNCKYLLQKFDGVSVREESGVDLCKTYFGVNAVWALDPTMLLEVEDYIALFKSANTPKSKGSLLYYVLDDTPEKADIIKKIETEKRLKSFRVGSKIDDLCAPLAERIQPPLEEWLRGFYDAEFIVTDSFHACVFSILFKKQFVVVANEKRGNSRIESLLKCFGLQNRLVNNNLDISTLDEIDYKSVYVKLEEKRKQSMKFIINSMK